jgi:hypothetical protein
MRGERVDAELLSSGVASDFGCFYDRHVRAVTAFVGSWIGEPEVVFDLVEVAVDIRPGGLPAVPAGIRDRGAENRTPQPWVSFSPLPTPGPMPRAAVVRARQACGMSGRD